jgi:hypothetical protein
MMSVRATDSLIAELVIVSGLTNSPKMVVQAVNQEQKLVTTVWFSDAHEAQQAVFPASSLDRANVTVVPSKGKVGRGRPARSK